MVYGRNDTLHEALYRKAATGPMNEGKHIGR